MRIREVSCKSMLVASKLPACDYVVNPYMGCSFACAYCYASFMGRFCGESIESWGRYLSVKVNAVEVFRRDLGRLSAKRRDATILLSSVTDAWQGPEKKYRLTRGVLETLREDLYPGTVAMLTKSPLVLRDLDVIAALPRKEVGVTITATDDAIGRFLEVQAPSAADRLRTLAELNAAGIPTYAFVGPLLPHYRHRRDLLDELFRRIRDTGTRALFVEHLNTSPHIQQRLQPLLARTEPEVRAVYRTARQADHRRALSGMVMDLVGKYGFEIRLGGVIDHQADRNRAAAP